jgi:hypothetical protein
MNEGFFRIRNRERLSPRWLSVVSARLRGLPGLAPAGEVLFFASPKKSTPKKGEPGASSRYAGTLRCSDRAGDPQTRPAGSDMRLSFSARSCATRLRTRRRGSKTEFNKDAPWRVLMGFSCWFPTPLCMCRGAQAGPDQGLRMSEPAGRVCADPGPVEHRRLPRRSRGHRHQGRLFFGDFLLAKQKKVTALPGAYPGKVTHGRMP